MLSSLDKSSDNAQMHIRLPLRRSISILVVLFTLLLLGVCAYLVQLHYTATFEIAQRNLHNLLIVQSQFNQEILNNIDDIVQVLAFDYENDTLNDEPLLNHYQQMKSDNSILDTLLLLDENGTVIFDSNETNLNINFADHPSFAIHPTQGSNAFFISEPTQKQETGEWVITISYGFYEDNNLDYVLLSSFIPMVWSDIFSDFAGLEEYVGVVTLDDGTVLTSFPYQPDLIGTKIDEAYLQSNTENALLPSIFNNEMSLIDSVQVTGYPLHLVIEVANTDAFFEFDAISAVILAIAILIVLSSIGVLVVYQYQHRTLQLQTRALNQINVDLKQQVRQRAQAEIVSSISEERYRLVTEIISDYAYSVLVRPDGTLEHEWITDSFRTMMGLSETDQVPFESPTTRTHPDDVTRVREGLQKTIEGKETVTEYRTQHKSGHYIWIRVKRRPIWDTQNNRVVRIIGAASNITAEKGVELALRNSEKRYRQVTELMSDYAFSTIVRDDGSRTREWVTESFFTMTGYDADHINTAPNPIPRTHPDDLEKVQADLARTFTGEDTTSEYRWRVASGEYIWTRVKRRAIWNDEGTKVIRVIGAVTDITEQKMAALALREREERYREVTELMTDYAFSISVASDGTESLDWVVGSYQEITGKSDILIRETNYLVSDEEEKQIIQDQKRTLAGETTTSEYRIRHQKTGEIRWLRVNRQPIWDENHQRVMRYIGATSDITAQKEAEQALQLNQQHYREVTELTSDYAFSIRMKEGNPTSIEWVVGSLEATTGLRPDQIMNSPNTLRELTHPDDQQKLEDGFAKTLMGHKTRTEYRIFHAKSKQMIWLEVFRQPIWDDEHNEVRRVVVVSKDVTAQVSTEIALADSEERYRLVSQLISDYVYSELLYPDQSSEIEWVAGSLESILGVSADDVMRLRRIPNRIHSDDLRHVNEKILNSWMGQVTVIEYRIIHVVDETIHWVRESRRPIWDNDQDRVIRIISAVSDITKEKENENKLRASEKRYRTLTDLMSDYVFSLSVSSTNQLSVEWFAGRFEEITGVPFEQFEVRSQTDMTQIAQTDDVSQAQQDIQLTLDGLPTLSVYRIINKIDNEPRWIRVSRYPEIDEETGRVIRILGATTDITMQKQAELALRDSEERYRLLTELMTDYAFSVRIEEDGRLYREWLIGDFEKIMGYSVPESGYLDEPQTNSPYEENINMVQKDIQSAMRGEATVAEYQVRNRQNNQLRWIRATRQPIWNAEHDRVIRYLGAVKDVTAEKEAEQIAQEADELRQDLAHEKGLHELRSRFVSMVTHEFRNPLAAIQSSVSILDKYNDRLTEESKQEKYVRIYGQIDRLTNLLEDLLQVGELENHMLRFSPQLVDIIAIIADLYNQYEQSIGKDHQLTLHHDFESISTFGDVLLLEQAFGNIISNAIKYSPLNSEIITTITFKQPNIVITVQDFGMGIPERDYEDLYKAFYRASNVSTQPGTGLGLIIAKQSIELHKGTIAFTSTVGKGTTFTIRIPQVIGKQGNQ